MYHRTRTGAVYVLTLALFWLVACHPHPTPVPPTAAPPAPVMAIVRVEVYAGDPAGDHKVAGAQVRLDGVGGEITDGAGNVEWRAVPPGPRHLFVTAEGYQPYDRHLELAPGVGHTIRVSLVRTWPRRRGLVRLDRRALLDDDGYFLAHGVTLFWAVWAYQHDRARLEATLRWLAEQRSIEYIRVLAVIGGRWWEDRAADPRAPGWDEAIAGVTDRAAHYGLRVEWTIFGETDQGAPTPAARRAVVDRLLAALAGREHLVMHLELANEAFLTGFGGSDGLGDLRALTRDLQTRTEIPVAVSSNHESIGLFCATYADGVGDLATIHFDRSIWMTEGPWRPVRQPWGYPGEYGCELPAAASSNEPIGIRSSVASESDPVRLVAQVLVAHVSGLALSVLHTEAGVWGGGASGAPGAAANLSEYPELARTLAILRDLEPWLPEDLPNWTRQNSHAAFSGRPFDVDALWVDGYDHGAVRVYSATQGSRAITIVIGVKDRVTLTARRAMTVSIRQVGGAITESRRVLGAGEMLTLRGTDTAWLIRVE